MYSCVHIIDLEVSFKVRMSITIVTVYVNLLKQHGLPFVSHALAQKCAFGYSYPRPFRMTHSM